MMRALMGKDLVIAQEVQKKEGIFYCPECKEMVILKKGLIKIDHFAHKVKRQGNNHCSYGNRGESEIHMFAKYSLYKELQSYGFRAELEGKLGSRRPDINYTPQPYIVPIALELQRSNLSIEEIQERTQDLTKIGVPVLWIIIDNKKNWTTYELYFKAMYFGKIFYYNTDNTLKVVYYNKGRRIREKIISLRFTDQFRIRYRNSYKQRDMEIPSCLIWDLKEGENNGGI